MMQKKYIAVLTMILCMLFCLSACQPAEPVDNHLTESTPTPSVGEVPENTESATDTEGTQTQTQTQTSTPTETPGHTPTETPEKTPTATKKPTGTANNKTEKPTETTKPNEYTQPYVLYVNRMQNVVTVYTADNKGNAVTPVKAMLCSTGRNNGTPTGSFAISEKYTWRPLYGNVYGQYASRFNGSILFHSVPYLKTNKGTLKPGEFNKLGTQASDGCVRLNVQDCKWIYDNCGKGTKVVVYDSADPGPLGKPTGLVIPDDAGWDPTDPDARNPWKTQAPVMPITFSGVSATTVELQRNALLPDLAAGVTATDALGRNVTDRIQIQHTIDMKKTGLYVVTYQVTDQSGTITDTAKATYQVIDKTAPNVSGLTTIHHITQADVEEMTQERLLQAVSITDDGDRLDFGVVSMTLNGQTYVPELLVAGEENHILLQINDGNGNVTERSVTVIVAAPTETPDGTESPEPTGTPEPTATPAPTRRPSFIQIP